MMLLSACGTRSELLKEQQLSEKPLLSAPSLIPVHFKPGHPKKREMLMDSLANDGGRELQILQENLRIMKSVYRNEFRFQITGFTSPSECEAETCIDLATRRADLVKRWLLENDVDAESLLSIQALGSVFTVGDESTESGRTKNMRVEFEVVNGK